MLISASSPSTGIRFPLVDHRGLPSIQIGLRLSPTLFDSPEASLDDEESPDGPQSQTDPGAPSERLDRFPAVSFEEVAQRIRVHRNLLVSMRFERAHIGRVT